MSGCLDLMCILVIPENILGRVRDISEEYTLKRLSSKFCGAPTRRSNPDLAAESPELREIVDQPVHWCLDTLHRHRIRYMDRPYGGKLSKDIEIE